MEKPDFYTIATILKQFHNGMKGAERVAAEDKSYSEFDAREKLHKLCEQMIYLAYTNEKYSFADLYIVEAFSEMQWHGLFNCCDGDGYYLDFDGNELDSINWYEPEDYPKDAVFVAWYNK